MKIFFWAVFWVFWIQSSIKIHQNRWKRWIDRDTYNFIDGWAWLSLHFGDQLAFHVLKCFTSIALFLLKAPVQLGARPLEGRGFFVINGVSWVILDVLVPIGFCLMWFLRPLAPYSGAYFQKHAFCLDETTIFEVFENSQTNSTWHVLMWFLRILRPLTPYSGAYFQKQAFRLDENTIFGFVRILNLKCLDSCVGHSNASGSSKNLCGSGLLKVQCQHHMNRWKVPENLQ